MTVIHLMMNLNLFNSVSPQEFTDCSKKMFRVYTGSAIDTSNEVFILSHLQLELKKSARIHCKTYENCTL